MPATPQVLTSSGRVLLVDDSPLALDTVGAFLRDHGLEVKGVTSGHEALVLATSPEQSFDLFILDVMMPDMSGHELTKRLRADTRTSHVPILFFTALDSTSDRVAGLEAGADDFFPKTVPNEEVLARVRNLISLGQMRAHLLAQHEAMARLRFDTPVPAEPRTLVLVVHATPVAVEPLIAQVREHLPASIVLEARAPSLTPERYETVDVSDAEVVLASWDLALGERGLLTRLGIQESAPPVIVLDDAESGVRRVQAFEDGADDYLVAQRPPVELAARIASAVRRQQRHDHLRRSRDRAVLAAVTDPLTGLHNRAFFQESLSVEVRRSLRYGRPLSLLLLDLDHFKRVNDALGHLAGDRALREVADRLRKAARATDIIARYGGEEFAVLLPETPRANALIAAERFRAALDGTPVVARAGTSTITVSIGVGSCPDHATEPDRLFEKTDAALYAAKAAGRNKVVGVSLVPEPDAPRSENLKKVDANELIDRLRAATQSPSQVASELAARLLKESLPADDARAKLVAQLLSATEETRRELDRLREELIRFLEQNR